MADQKAYWDGTKTCPVCGKRFLPAIQHSYKIREKGEGGHLKLVCSWRCVRVFEKNDTVKRVNRRWKRNDLY